MQITWSVLANRIICFLQSTSFRLLCKNQSFSTTKIFPRDHTSHRGLDINVNGIYILRGWIRYEHWIECPLETSRTTKHYATEELRGGLSIGSLIMSRDSVGRTAEVIFFIEEWKPMPFTTQQYKHTEKYFRDLIKSNRNQIVFIIFRLICNQTNSDRLLFQINRKLVNIVWFWFDLIRFLCMCGPVHSTLYSTRLREKFLTIKKRLNCAF